ncbi:MAG: hypothetical protein B7Y40_10900 [Gammaproteobacteria bacterium 28-57-27]|nr:MAG: hypothetical protein B7Y40_10900 [Gammaproteobacteria bacterium 28-57-27]
MPTVKPRITVTLNQHVYDVFDRLAQLQGTSKGALIADILDTVYPPLMRTVALLEAAMDAPEQVRQGLKRNLESVERDMVKSSGGCLAQMDWMIEGVREASNSQVDPPLVTRGSGSLSKGVSPLSKYHQKPTRARVPKEFLVHWDAGLVAAQKNKRKQAPKALDEVSTDWWHSGYEYGKKGG